MKKIKVLSLILLVSLTSCNSSSNGINKLNFKILSPSGAPSIAYSSFIKESKDNISIVEPSSMASKISSKEYDAFIFDLSNACKLIKNNNLDYKLVTCLTIGNCYCVSTGNDLDNTISSDDKIVSFGSNSTFTKIFEKIHNVKVSYEVSGVSQTPSIIKTGKYNGEDIDYVLVAEPVLTSLFSSKSDNDKYTLVENVTTKWQEYSKKEGLNDSNGYSGYIQAGLFISSKLEKDEYKDDINYFLNTIKETIYDIKNNNASATLNNINEFVKSNLIEEDYFGVNYSILNKVLNSSTNPNNISNPFGFNWGDFDINKFIKESNLDGLDQIDDSLFSKYYI